MPRKSGPRRIRVAALRELQRILDAWENAHVRERLPGAERAARAAERHLAGLRKEINFLVSDRQDRRRTLDALDRVARRLEFYQQFYGADHDSGRPRSWAPFRAQFQKVMDRHDVDATTLATAIVERLAPLLPADLRRELVGDYPDKAKRISHLADRL